LHTSWAVHLQRNHPPLKQDLSFEIPKPIGAFEFSFFLFLIGVSPYFDFPMKLKTKQTNLSGCFGIHGCFRFFSGDFSYSDEWVFGI
jgi:hypothetical protein